MVSPARGQRMTFSKRMFDILFALALCVVLGPVILGLTLALLVLQGRPLFYAGERMRSVDQGFRLLKFRTMHVAADCGGVSGGDKQTRITPMGRFLRRTRLDELPQLWNILRGDISFVGPRPPLRRYVDSHPDLYARVLACRPGVTGLATVIFHRTEERLLAPCKTPQETERVYVQRCIPRKARLDLIYCQRQSLALDMWLIWRTIIWMFAR